MAASTKKGEYDISMIEDSEYLKRFANLYGEDIDIKSETFYKERWITEPERAALTKLVF